MRSGGTPLAPFGRIAPPTVPSAGALPKDKGDTDA